MTKKTIPYLETITLIEESVKNLNGLRGHNFYLQLTETAFNLSGSVG